MSGNVEVVRVIYAAIGRGDRATIRKSVDEDIRWEVLDGYPSGGTYTGFDAVFDKFFPGLLRHFDGWQARPDEFLDAGEDVVVLGRYHGTAKATGRVLDAPFAHIWHVVGGRAVRMRQFTDTSKFDTVLTVR